MNEAKKIMEMTLSDGLALTEKVKGGAPEDVRRFALYSAWRGIESDRGIPSKLKRKIFRELFEKIEILVLANG